MARSPSRWWERLCRVPAEQRAVSTSPVFCMARTTADTICGERIRAWREASFLESWCTITAALFTTTWRERKRRRLTTACLSIWEGSASRCTAVGWAASSGVGGICTPSSRVSGNMAARTRCARVMAQPSMEGAEVVTPDWMPESSGGGPLPDCGMVLATFAAADRLLVRGELLGALVAVSWRERGQRYGRRAYMKTASRSTTCAGLWKGKPYSLCTRYLYNTSRFFISFTEV
ncbi:hypothetical protein CRUP_021623 [Coryphaenoides rupestris]|nr:hypothetical protein CRUP_021623 [Coryphaenoides rupestris]